MWLYQNEPVNENTFEGYVAFVYLITNLETGRQYVGKKRLTFVKRKKLKRRKNKIKVIKESDWKTYFGSSEDLKADVQRLGEEKFKREILHLCSRLSEANYLELKEQVMRDVLYKPDEYYNSYLGTRVSRKQLGVK